MNLYTPETQAPSYSLESNDFQTFRYASLVISILLITVSTLVFLSLISELMAAQMIGKLGTSMATFLNYVFGKYLAFGTPFLFLGLSIAVWPRRSPQRLPFLVEGGFLAIVCLAALLSIDVAHATPDISIARAGTIGTFLMHRDVCNLTGFLGTVGAYLTFSSLLLVSIILMTNRNPFDVFKLIIQKIRDGSFIIWIRDHFTEEVDEEEDDEDAEFYEDESSRNQFDNNPYSLGVNENEEDSTEYPSEDDEKDAYDNDEDAEKEISDEEETPEIVLPKAQEAPHKRRKTEAKKTEHPKPIIDVYNLPEMDLLTAPPPVNNHANELEAHKRADAIVGTLADFDVPVTVTNIVMGPSVTRYEIQPSPGVKVERITALENNLTMAMEARQLRIIAPIPGKAAVGIEVPNKRVQPVFLSELLNSQAFRASTAPLAFALGKNIEGQPHILDLARMPHLLIAGTTGSGKSVCLNSIIVSILFHMPPDRVKMIMVDPKQVELSVYRDIPHLLAPVVTNPTNAAAALAWACEEMEERLTKMSKVNARNIDGYNSYVNSQRKKADPELVRMPHIVVIIDELADLMFVAKKDVEDSIVRLAAKARAAGIHLILATQRPSVDVITGLIKANFPARIAFQVASIIDSRTILDIKGAEALQGKGDMLLSQPGSMKPERIQGCYVSDAEVEAVAEYVRSQTAPDYLEAVATDSDEEGDEGAVAEDGSIEPAVPWNDDRYQPRGSASHSAGRSFSSHGANGHSSNPAESMNEKDKDLYEQAIKLVFTHKMASQSMLMRRLRVGFTKAGWLMDQMEDEGLVGPSQNGRPRDLLVDPDELLAQRGWNAVVD